MKRAPVPLSLRPEAPLVERLSQSFLDLERLPQRLLDLVGGDEEILREPAKRHQLSVDMLPLSGIQSEPGDVLKPQVEIPISLSAASHGAKSDARPA